MSTKLAKRKDVILPDNDIIPTASRNQLSVGYVVQNGMNHFRLNHCCSGSIRVQRATDK